MYVRSKKVKRGSKKATSFYRDNPEEYTYYQLVEGYRDEDGKVRQRVLAHLGRHDSVEAALEDWRHMADVNRRRAADHRYAAEKWRERSRENLSLEDWRRKRFHSTNYSRSMWLLPRAGTEVPEEPPFARRLSPTPAGWMGVAAKTPEDVERQAAEYAAKAEDYERRIAHLRNVVTKNVTPAERS